MLVPPHSYPAAKETPMNSMNKRFLVAWLVVAFISLFGDAGIHGGILHADYATLPNLFRPEAETQSLMGWMILAHILIAAGFVWIYSRGISDRPWLGQGVRFGGAVAVLTVIPTYMIYFVVQPTPGAMAVKQIILGTALIVVMGVVTAFLYRTRSALR